MTLDRLSHQDVQILKAERGAIRGHTCKVLLLDPPVPSLEALRDHIMGRLDRAPRLRKRLVRPPLGIGTPVWIDDRSFDIARHVTRVDAGGPIRRDALTAIVADLISKPLERSHPLWHLALVEDLEDGSGALIWRLHHCMADGTECVRIGTSLLWSEVPDEALLQPIPWIPAQSPRRLALLIDGLRHEASLPHVRRRRAANGDRRPPLRQIRQIVKRELSPSAALTPLAEAPGSARTVAFASTSLQRCKQAGKAIDRSVTLNDVVLALITGGVRAWIELTHGPAGWAWLKERGEAGRQIRVKVPVSLHHPGESRVANRDSYFFVDLPVAVADPVQRLLTISMQTRLRKGARDAEALYHLGANPLIARWAMNPRVFTFNVSNVRGPAQDVYVCGARVRELYSIAEIALRHTMRVAVMSAAGRLSFGISADAAAVGNVDVFAAGINRASEELFHARAQ